MNLFPLPSSLFPLASAALLLMQGCQSYTIVQRNIFADDDGNVLIVDYGRSESDHVNTFVAPATGKEMEYRSRLMVKVGLPDGDSFKAWRCMNFLPRGTMYQSDDEEWKLLANGFSCVVYHQTDEKPPRYLEVYRGVICDTPEMEIKKNDKWRDITTRGREYKKKTPVSK